MKARGAVMRRHVLRRMLQMLFVVIGSVTVVFFVTRMLPVDPAVVLAGPEPSEAVIEATRTRLGLDRPLPEQFATYVQALLRGDLGRSAISGADVTADLATRLPATLELVFVSLALAVGVSFVLAVVAARAPGGRIDRFVNRLILIRTALPAFFVGVSVVWMFYTVLAVAPAPVGRLPIGMAAPPVVTRMYLIDSLLAGRADVFFAAAAHLALPALVLSSGLVPPLVRVLRGSLRQALRSDSVLALQFTPVSRARRWFAYVLPLSVVPTLTLLAASFGSLVGGTVVVEHIFAWNGLGSYVLQGIHNGDYYVVQGVVLISAFAYAAAFFAVDLVTWIIDPRTLEVERRVPQ